jgi:WD40 repeat protein
MHNAANRFVIVGSLAAAVLLVAAPPRAFGQRRVILKGAVGSKPAASSPARGMGPNIEDDAFGEVVSGQDRDAARIVFSSDGKRLLVAGFGGVEASVWDIDAAKRVCSVHDSEFQARPMPPGPGPVFSPDGKQVACPGQHTSFAREEEEAFLPQPETALKLRDAASGEFVRKFQHPGKRNFFSILVASPKWQWVASTGDTDTVCLWNMQTGTLHATLKCGQNSAMALAWSPDGKMLAANCCAVERRTMKHATGEMSSVGPRALGDITVRIWDAQKGADKGSIKIGRYPIVGGISDYHEGHSNWLTFSADGRLLATMLTERVLVICDVESRRLMHTVRNTVADKAAFTATGKALVCCQCFGRARNLSLLDSQPLVIGRVDLKTGNSKVVCRRHWPGAGMNIYRTVACVAMTSDGDTLAVPDAGGKVLLLDTSTGKPRRVLDGPRQSRPACVAFSPEGTRVVEGTQEGDVVVGFLADSAAVQPAETENAKTSVSTR